MREIETEFLGSVFELKKGGVQGNLRERERGIKENLGLKGERKGGKYKGVSKGVLVGLNLG